MTSAAGFVAQMRTLARVLPFAVLLLPGGVARGQVPADEFKVKAAFIYNFLQYVEWPPAAFADAQTPFRICVFGADPFGEHLQALASRSHRGRPIAVGSVKTVAEARRCHLLYVDELRANGLANDVEKALQGSPVLTVSSAAKATEAGVIIGFVPTGERMRWSVNLDAARVSRIRLSAKLVEIAVAVLGEVR